MFSRRNIQFFSLLVAMQIVVFGWLGWLYVETPPEAHAFIQRLLYREELVDAPLRVGASPSISETDNLLEVSGGRFTEAGWQVESVDDFIDFDIKTSCRGSITFDVTGLNETVMNGRDFGSLFSMYDDYETGVQINPDYFVGACYESAVFIGGTEERELRPPNRTCDDIRGGRSLISDPGAEVCVFNSTSYLFNDLIVQHHLGKISSYQHGKQSDGAPYLRYEGVEKLTGEQNPPHPTWDPDATYTFEITWNPLREPDNVARLRVRRIELPREPAKDDPGIINFVSEDGQSVVFDTIITENEMGHWAPVMGRLRLGNSSILTPEGSRLTGHAIPGAVFSNVSVQGTQCDPDVRGCPTYENTSCTVLEGPDASVDPTFIPYVQEDPPLVSGLDVDKPPDLFDFSIKPNFSLPPLKIEVRFRGDTYAKFLKENIESPRTRLRPATKSPRRGDKASVIVQNEHFKGTPDEAFTAWFVDDVFQGGVVAGGKWIDEVLDDVDEHQQVKHAALIGPACRPITRTPAPGDDENNNGMSDRWERQYFGGEADPDGNPDGDGCFSGIPRNAYGQPLFSAPLLYAVVDGEERFMRLDGPLTNLMEYILGTDPTDADTDGDGVNDGCDVLGKGQMVFEFVTDKPVRQSYRVRGSSSGPNFHFLSSFVSNEEPLQVSAGGQFSVAFVHSPELPQPDGEVTVTASVAGGKNSLENLDFQWSVVKPTQINLCDPAQRCGVGRNQITHNIGNARPGDVITFEVVVSERATGQRIREQYDLVVQGGASIAISVCGDGDTSCSRCDDTDQVPARGQYVKAVAQLAQASSGGRSYIWNLDGRNINDTRVSNNQFCFETTKASPSAHSVGLIVHNEVGQQYVAPTVNVQVGYPLIDFEINPSPIFSNNMVEVRAIPQNFPSAPVGFDFEWVIDGVKQTTFTDTIQFAAGDGGDRHAVSLRVRYLSSPEITLSASTEIRVETGLAVVHNARAFASRMYVSTKGALKDAIANVFDLL
jgi:hypothetical protein